MKLRPFLFLLIACSSATAATPEEKIAALEQRVAKLEEALAKAPAESKPSAKPGNKYGIPDGVYNKIKADAEAQFPNDFSVQKFAIETQVKAYKELQEK